MHPFIYILNGITVIWHIYILNRITVIWHYHCIHHANKQQKDESIWEDD